MSDSTTDADGADASTLLLYRAEYASTLFSSTSYGLYLAFSGIAVYLLLANGAIYAARRFTLTYTSLMFIVTTTWYISGARNSAYFLVDDTATPEAVELTTKVCAMLQFLLSDSVILFRLYMTWNRDIRIMVLPALMYLTCIVFGILAELYSINSWFEARSQTIRTTFFGTTVALNAFATVAIAYKLLVIMRDVSRSGRRIRGIEERARTILMVIIESGALYSIVGIVSTVYFCSGSPISNLLSSMFQTLSFLNPAFIILRVAMGISYEYEVSQSASQRPIMNDLEKALPPLPPLNSQRGSVVSFASLDEKQSVIMVAKKVDMKIR